MIDRIRMAFQFLTGKAKRHPPITDKRGSTLAELNRAFDRKLTKIETLCAVVIETNDQINTLRTQAHVLADHIAVLENELETGEVLDKPRPASHWADRSDLPLT